MIKISEGRPCFMLGDHGRVGLDRTYKVNFNINRQRKVINCKGSQNAMSKRNKKQRKKSQSPRGR